MLARSVKKRREEREEQKATVRERPLTTWRELLTKALLSDGSTMSDDDFSTTLTDEELDEKFDAGYGTAEGTPFTAWTSKRVYFPVTYDGAEWIESVPRNPCDERTRHVGGQ